MQKLSQDDIRHLSQLARLELTEEESTHYAEQLSSVVDYITQLQEVDVSKVSPRFGVTNYLNVLAADVPRDANDANAIEGMDVISTAPRSKGRLIEVRAVLSETEAS